MTRWDGQPGNHACQLVQEQRLSLFGHIARMPDEADARSIITASPLENCRKPPGRPRTTWMKTIQQDLRSNNLSLDEAITVAQYRPLWRQCLRLVLRTPSGACHTRRRRYFSPWHLATGEPLVWDNQTIQKCSMQTTINHVFVSSSLFFYYYYYILHYWPTYRQSKNKYQCLLNHEELPYFLFLQICSKHYKTAQKQDKIKQTKILTAIGCLFIIEMCIYV